jgi:hypothetical protein
VNPPGLDVSVKGRFKSTQGLNQVMVRFIPVPSVCDCKCRYLKVVLTRLMRRVDSAVSFNIAWWSLGSKDHCSKQGEVDLSLVLSNGLKVMTLRGGLYWRLNSGPHTCQVGILLLEPGAQPFFLWLFLR